MSTVTTIAGQLDAKGLKIAIVATRFNDFIVDRLVGGAQDYLERHGLDTANITLVRIPGAFEMPLVCQKLVNSGKYDGVLALGAVIRGGTPHFDYVCAEASKGIAQAMMHSGVPIGFGLLTCDTIEQAIEAEAQAQAICMQTEDFRRAYEAFAAKQKPVFQGDQEVAIRPATSTHRPLMEQPSIEPFTLSLSKRCEGLRQAQPERVGMIERAVRGAKVRAGLVHVGLARRAICPAPWPVQSLLS